MLLFTSYTVVTHCALYKYLWYLLIYIFYAQILINKYRSFCKRLSVFFLTQSTGVPVACIHIQDLLKVFF